MNDGAAVLGGMIVEHLSKNTGSIHYLNNMCSGRNISKDRFANYLRI